MKIVFGVLLSAIILISLPGAVLAQTETSTGSADITQDATPSAIYSLPYPGILPDNPLYFLKAIRDKIIGFLINDTLKKAEFNLLTSDKRLYASSLLMEKGKQDLAITTLSKSNNYFNDAIIHAREAARQGKNADTVLSNLNNAVEKREEIFSAIEENLAEEYLSRLEVERERLESFKKIAQEQSSD